LHSQAPSAPDVLLPRRKRALFIAVIFTISTAVSLVCAEYFLRSKQARIAGSDRMDPGMIRYDRGLGWRLVPEWQGRHRHYDFDVQYTINPYGFRSAFMGPPRPDRSTYAIVGDSFAFGLGVNDADTFVHRLNTNPPGSGRYLNFSMPGFSTDQEYLLLRETVFSFLPDAVALIVYLGNDLFDNELPFPLQAENAKPYYEQTPEGLVLKNSPVPLARKPTDMHQLTLNKVVMGNSEIRGNAILRFLNRSALFRLLGFNPYEEEDLQVPFGERFDPKLDLFSKILGKIRGLCSQKRAELSLILMPGKSFVLTPHSTSAWYQDYLRKEIVRMADRMKVNVIDLASLLRLRYDAQPGAWFHPNEGNLTVDGHRVVADILDRHLPKAEKRR